VNPTTISVFRAFQPPVAEVWTHITRPELLAQWLGRAELELLHDGEMSLEAWNGEIVRGRVLSVAAPAKLQTLHKRWLTAVGVALKARLKLDTAPAKQIQKASRAELRTRRAANSLAGKLGIANGCTLTY